MKYKGRTIISIGGAHAKQGSGFRGYSINDLLDILNDERARRIAYIGVLSLSVVLFCLGYKVAVWLNTTAETAKMAELPQVTTEVTPAIAVPTPTAEPAVVVSVDQTEALAMGIDAVVSSVKGSEAVSDTTLLMVANTILNRVEDARYPATVDQVLCQPMQFSCFAESGLKWVGRAANDAYFKQRCMDAATRAMDGERLLSYGVVYVSSSRQGTTEAVSYTHLTLPTILLV